MITHQIGAKSKYEITIQENTRLILRISELHQIIADLNEQLADAKEQIIDAVIGNDNDNENEVRFELQLSEPLVSSPISKMKPESTSEKVQSESPKIPKLKIPAVKTEDKATSPRSFRVSLQRIHSDIVGIF